MPQSNTTHPKPVLWIAVARGMIGKCPCCGTGKLFLKYLKQTQTCDNCQEPLGHIRADDGPTWLTIFILGHIMATLILTYSPTSTWPEWVDMVIWPGIAGILALGLLPLCKGIFIGFIWHSKSLNPRI